MGLLEGARYCTLCGARIEGPGAYGHDTGCPADSPDYKRRPGETWTEWAARTESRIQSDLDG